MSESDFDWDVDDPGGTSFVGYLQTPWSFEETVARLVALSGKEPAATADKYKMSVSFLGRFKGKKFDVYDYKEGRELHVGGDPPLPVRELCAALVEALSRVEPTPYRVREHYDLCGWHGWPETGAAR